MQRRLTIALVSLTLFAVLLVGTGVLIFGAIGARQETEDRVLEQLGAFVDLSESIPNIERVGPLMGRFGQAFEADDLAVVTVDGQGVVRSPQMGHQNQSGGNRNSALTPFTLEPQDHARFLQNEAVLLDEAGAVVGVQLLPYAVSNRPGISPAVLVSQRTAALPTQARQWFLISATLALLTSVIVASFLARRFTQPIQAIQAATTRLAEGNLSTRVQVSGQDEVAALGHSVNKMAGDLERSRQLEQQFLLSVSHDLRTPLTSISGYAEALIDGAIDEPARAGSIIRSHADRLNRLVTDLLDLAKLDTNQFRINSTVLATGDLVATTIAGLAPLADRHELELSLSGPLDLSIRADPDRLAQVVANLIENAIKYARQTVHIRITRVESASGEPEVTISVDDDGPGIPPEDLPHIFERLYVTQRRPRREESSSGLGLAIVRQLTEAMDGSVTAQQSALGGTSIVLRFPVADSVTPPGVTTPETH